MEMRWVAARDVTLMDDDSECDHPMYESVGMYIHSFEWCLLGYELTFELIHGKNQRPKRMGSNSLASPVSLELVQ
jgi:hypothetical protein